MKNLKTTAFLTSVFSFIIISNIFSMGPSEISEDDIGDPNPPQVTTQIEEKNLKVSKLKKFWHLFSLSCKGATDDPNDIDEGISEDNFGEIDDSNIKEAVNQIELYSMGERTTKSFENFDLSNTLLNNKNLAGIILIMANLENSNLQNSDLKDSKLVAAILIQANLTSTDFENADLSKSDISNNDKIINTSFVLTKLNSANIQKSRIFSSNFIDSNLNDTNFSGSLIKNSNFNKAIVNKTIFANTILDNCTVMNMIINKSNFKSAILSGCRLSWIIFDDVNFKNIILQSGNKPTIFRHCEFKKVNFLLASLINVIFKKCTFWIFGENACKNLDSLKLVDNCTFYKSTYKGDYNKKIQTGSTERIEIKKQLEKDLSSYEKTFTDPELYFKNMFRNFGDVHFIKSGIGKIIDYATDNFEEKLVDITGGVVGGLVSTYTGGLISVGAQKSVLNHEFKLQKDLLNIKDPQKSTLDTSTIIELKETPKIKLAATKKI